MYWEFRLSNTRHELPENIGTSKNVNQGQIAQMGLQCRSSVCAARQWKKNKGPSVCAKSIHQAAIFFEAGNNSPGSYGLTFCNGCIYSLVLVEYGIII
ncbi:hypothetical protein H5410_034848 [Solanum commersonii]|uniref:Uncharacterized protein n=1 Tax=Solanum commersonii TaxID=4109 RepID=A0A9J5Y248_SOLCO|nr:hypothetical protein H5410_034848 [Solanum commersonii]